MSCKKKRKQIQRNGSLSAKMGLRVYIGLGSCLVKNKHTSKNGSTQKYTFVEKNLIDKKPLNSYRSQPLLL